MRPQVSRQPQCHLGTGLLTHSLDCPPWFSSHPPLSSWCSFTESGEGLFPLPSLGDSTRINHKKLQPNNCSGGRNGKAEQGEATSKGLLLPTLTSGSQPSSGTLQMQKTTCLTGPGLWDWGRASCLTLDNRSTPSRFMRLSSRQTTWVGWVMRAIFRSLSIPLTNETQERTS